jgi:integrase
VANIQERIGKDGTAKYRVQIRTGRKYVTRTFRRKTDADRWARDTETDMGRGLYQQTVESQKHTFGDMVDRYVGNVLPAKSPSTSRAQVQQMEWWKNELGHHLLAEITPAMIVECRDELLRGVTRDGTKRSPSTVTRYLAALSHCYSVAMKEWGWVDDTPMRKISRPKEPTGRVRYLDKGEVERLLDICRDSSNDYLYSIVLLAVSTGMRKGEILSLTWDRVELDRGVLILSSEQTKNRTARAIPLAGQAHAEMLRLKRVPRRIDTKLVFPGSATSTEPKPINIDNAWRKVLELADIKDFRFHDLRHTAASHLAMNGATLAEIAEVLGHKTLAMVKRYSHLSEQHTSDVVRRMNEGLLGA